MTKQDVNCKGVKTACVQNFQKLFDAVGTIKENDLVHISDDIKEIKGLMTKLLITIGGGVALFLVVELIKKI